MTLDELRKEFPLGNLSCTSCGGTVFVYIRARTDLVATIYTKLDKDGSLRVVKIVLVVDQKGSRQLACVAAREKIPQEILTKAMIKQIAKESPV